MWKSNTTNKQKQKRKPKVASALAGYKVSRKTPNILYEWNGGPETFSLTLEKHYYSHLNKTIQWREVLGTPLIFNSLRFNILLGGEVVTTTLFN